MRAARGLHMAYGRLSAARCVAAAASATTATAVARVHGLASVRAAAPASAPPLAALAAATLASGRRGLAAPAKADSYHAVADRTLDLLMEQLDALGDAVALPGYDASFSNGVVTLKLGAHGTYVLNKQPPNRQIWLSSPVSGPRRFEWKPSTRGWHATSDNVRLDALLASELSHHLGEPVSIVFDLEAR